MVFLLLTSPALVASLAWHLICIYINYRQARLVGLPIIVTPINALNPLWVLSQPWLIPILQRVPFGLCNFVNYSSLSRPYADKHTLHDQLGDAFMIVGPGEN